MTTVITRAEVKKHRHRNSLWLIVHDQVYDVTQYLEEHPGGEDVLLDNAGTDATQAFEDVGHSEDARELLKKYIIGTLPDDEKSKVTVVPVCCKSKKPRRDKSCVRDCPSTPPVKNCMTAHRMSKRDGSSRRSGSISGKSSCSSVASCLSCNKPPPLKSPVKSWQNFDVPPNSNLTKKSSKSTRFVVPPDICDEDPTSTSAPCKIVVDKENSNLPQTRKKNKSYWKWLALAVLIGAVAVGVMVKKRS